MGGWEDGRMEGWEDERMEGWEGHVTHRVPPSCLGLLQPGKEHGLQGDHVVVGQRQ